MPRKSLIIVLPSKQFPALVSLSPLVTFIFAAGRPFFVSPLPPPPVSLPISSFVSSCVFLCLPLSPSVSPCVSLCLPVSCPISSVVSPWSDAILPLCVFVLPRFFICLPFWQFVPFCLPMSPCICRPCLPQDSFQCVLRLCRSVTGRPAEVRPVKPVKVTVDSISPCPPCLLSCAKRGWTTSSKAGELNRISKPPNLQTSVHPPA